MTKTAIKAQVKIVREIVTDEDADTSYLEQEDWDERRDQYQRGLFAFCGVRAVAEIRVPYGHDWITTTLKSPGLWSIEDDSDESYLQQVFLEERNTLLDMLKSLHEFEVVE